jgi:hypothetical protein
LIGNESDFSVYLILSTGTLIALFVISQGLPRKFGSLTAMNVAKSPVCTIFQKMFGID